MLLKLKNVVFIAFNTCICIVDVELSFLFLFRDLWIRCSLNFEMLKAFLHGMTSFDAFINFVNLLISFVYYRWLFLFS